MVKIRTHYFIFTLIILSACSQSKVELQAATQGAIATMIPTSTVAPVPTPTEEALKLNNTITIEEFPLFPNHSRVTLKDLNSEKVKEAERKWLDEHPFSENAVPFKDIVFKTTKGNQTTSSPTIQGEITAETETKTIMYTGGETDYSDLETRPYKIISIYILWDEELFKQIGITDAVLAANPGSGTGQKFANFGIISWAWLNIDGSTVICHTLDSLKRNTVLKEMDEWLYFQSVEINVTEIIPSLIIQPPNYINKIYELYPKLQTSELAQEWVNTNIMPKELESKLFFAGAGVKSPW